MHVEHWVLVAGGFHDNGGMDKANLALAEALIRSGRSVHIVAHDIEPELANHERVTVHSVARIAGSTIAGEQFLDARGRAVAARVTKDYPGARVVVNGGNCMWGDINWIHCVHHAWDCVDDGAPVWFKAKNRLMKWHARKRELRSVGMSKLIIANSRRTKNEVARHLGAGEDKIHTVYLGAESEWDRPTLQARMEDRRSFGLPDDRPVVAFVGALSFDNNKGFDTLCAAWEKLCRCPEWTAHLAVAGTGSAVSAWKSKCSRGAAAGRIHFLGYTDRIRNLLGAADLLVSPVRYEAYGLNVQEAVCLGTPAIVSATAGIAERYPEELRPLLLNDPEDEAEVVERLRLWDYTAQHWSRRTADLAIDLKRHSWADMARRMLILIEERSCTRQVTGQ